jgi:hypothetical protein
MTEKPSYVRRVLRKFLMNRVAATVGAFLISAVVLFWILGEAAAPYVRGPTGALVISQPADHFGLGLLGMIVVQLLSVVGAAGVAIITWGSFTSRLLPNKPLQPTRAAQPNEKQEPSGNGPRG